GRRSGSAGSAADGKVLPVRSAASTVASGRVTGASASSTRGRPASAGTASATASGAGPRWNRAETPVSVANKVTSARKKRPTLDCPILGGTSVGSRTWRSGGPGARAVPHKTKGLFSDPLRGEPVLLEQLLGPTRFRVSVLEGDEGHGHGTALDHGEGHRAAKPSVD